MRARPAVPRSGGHGFTMLELMVVAGILAVLLGLGVGFLGRGSGTAEARSAIAGQLRSAALFARSTGLPTEVLVLPGKDGENAVVKARGLQPIAVWSFEPGQRQLDAALEPTLGGADVEHGRYGHARAPLADKQAVLRVALPPTSVDLTAGFALRFDLRLASRRSGVLLRLSRSLEVAVDDEARPSLRLVASGGRGTAVNLQGKEPLPVGRWCTFEVAANGDEAWLAVDGRVLDRQSLRESLLQAADDVLELAPGDQSVDGWFDEVQLLAYVFGEPMQLPMGVLPQAALRIAFDADGNPVAPPRIELRITAEERVETLLVGQGGVLQ